jgi:hypothetical protein
LSGNGPTNALTYDWNDATKVSYKPGDGAIRIPAEKYPEEEQIQTAEIRVMKNGPYLVEGQFKVLGADGREMKRMRITSFCRCGKSGCMPLCDGSHRKSGLRD